MPRSRGHLAFPMGISAPSCTSSSSRYCSRHWVAGLDRVAGAFGRGDARQYPRCARYDDFWRLLPLLPDNGVVVAGAAVVGVETRVIAR